MHSPGIVIDAGHGPAKPGAIANGVDEQALAWILADEIQRQVASQGVAVTATRPWYFSTPSLAQRVELANAENADLFISVHLNANPSPRPRGTEVYHYGPSARGAELAQVMAKALQEATGDRTCRVIGSPSRGYQRTLYVLQKTAMPALLLEADYITNAQAAARFKSPEFPTAFCMGAAAGAIACLRHIDRLPKTGGNT